MHVGLHKPTPVGETTRDLFTQTHRVLHICHHTTFRDRQSISQTK